MCSGKICHVETGGGILSVYLSPDRTVEQRKERKRLMGVLSEKRLSCPEKKFGIRRGAVVELN